MKTISFRDLQLCEELSHFNEIEMLCPENDDLMKSVLSQIGIDTDYDIQYIPSRHRDMQGKIGIGFMAVGDISINRKFINSPMCSLTDRIVAAAYQDPSHARELISMSGGRQSFYGLSEVDAEEAGLGESDIGVEEDYEWVGKQIAQLQNIHDSIRGVGK